MVRKLATERVLHHVVAKSFSIDLDVKRHLPWKV